MARIASDRPLPKPHVFAAPVGEKQTGPIARADRACCFCGYLKCGCRRDMYEVASRSAFLRGTLSALELHREWAKGKTNIPLF